MRTYTVYQPQGSDNRDLRFELNYGDEPTVFAEASFVNGYYTLVADIEAASLDDVFQIGNIGPEGYITRYDRMTSVSVGDIIVDREADEYYMVAKFGFTKLFADADPNDSVGCAA
jgi:hypothetical protein